MIKKIIGIGDGGSQIGKSFLKYYDYSLLTVSENGDIKIPKAKKPEDLEDLMIKAKKDWSKRSSGFY